MVESYYLILVTRRRQIGTLCGHVIYCIDESRLITVPHSTVQTEASHSKVELRKCEVCGWKPHALRQHVRLECLPHTRHSSVPSEDKSANVLAVLGSVAADALDLTGYYYSGKTFVSKRKSQQSLIPTAPSITPGTSLSPLRYRTGSLDLSSDRPLALDLGSRQLSLDLGKLFSAVGNSTMNGRLIFQEVVIEKIAPVIDKASEPFYQNDVRRTNCIDCLDGTNVAQYAYGLEALGRQLQGVGLTDIPKLDPDCGVAAALMDMYQNMGDSLALQYGGSEAHNYVFPERQGKWKVTTHSQEFMKSIRRYYSNTIADGKNQDVMNLFLGHFQPQ